MAKYWQGSPIKNCNLCKREIKKRFVDGAMSRGRGWTILCADKEDSQISCYERHGAGLGIGTGQMYEKQPDGSWLNITKTQM